MPLDLGAAVNSGSEWITRAPIVRTVMSNPIYTALLLTALIILVLAYIKDGSMSDSWRATIKTFVYIFIAALAVITVHHYTMVSKFRSEGAGENVRRTFDSIQQAPTYGGAVYPVGDQHSSSSEPHIGGMQLVNSMQSYGPEAQELYSDIQQSYVNTSDATRSDNLHYDGGSDPRALGLSSYIVDVPLPAVKPMPL